MASWHPWPSVFNRDAEIPGFKGRDDCVEMTPLEVLRSKTSGVIKKEAPGFSPERFTRRANRGISILVVVLVFLWGGLAAAAGSRDSAVTEALGDFFPQADSYEATTHDFDGRTLEAHTAKAAGAVVGWAIRLEEMGKRYPIVFFVGLNPQGEIVGVRVLEYHDVFGKKVGRPSFLRQFRGKTIKDTLRIGQDIDAVTQATISSGAAVKAVRRSLEFFKEHLAEERK